MNSAWLKTPLDIYEAHVELPQVGQAPAIRAAIRDAVAAHQPQSFLYLGCAGGNGLSEIPAATRLLGIDLSSDYLRCLEARHAGRPATWLQHDLNHPLPPLETFDLAFGALIFEYLQDPAALLATLPARRLNALLLATDSQAPAVSDSPYRQQLLPVGQEFRYLDSAAFLAAATPRWQLESQSIIPLPAGKHFINLMLRAR